MVEHWFVGQGWVAVAVGMSLFAISGAILLWLRGPGARPHDPPVNREAVRFTAIMFAVSGTAWLIGAVAGMGGVILVGAIALVVILGASVRARARS